MTSSEGGFFSAEDADSEGIEGKFYVWSLKELKNNLSREDLDIVLKSFNILEEGNFLEEATREKTGNNIFHIKDSEEDLKGRFDEIREKLFRIREERIHPQKDDKILTDWNGLMIAALAKGAIVFQNETFLNAAKKRLISYSQIFIHQGAIYYIGIKTEWRRLMVI